MLDLQGKVKQAEATRHAAVRAHVLAGLVTALGVIGIIGGGAAVIGDIAMLLAPEPTGVTKVAGIAAIVGGGTALVSGIGLTATGAIGVEDSIEAKAAADALKTLLEGEQTEAGQLAIAIQLLHGNIRSFGRPANAA